MEKWRESRVLKIISYIMLPIITAILLISIMKTVLSAEYGINDKEKGYLQTNHFAEGYFQNIISNTSNVQRYKTENDGTYHAYGNYREIEDKLGKVYYSDTNYYYDYTFRNVDYLIKDIKTGAIYTNIKSNDYEKEIEQMKTKKIYWIYENDTVSTNLESISEDNLKYSYSSYDFNRILGNYEIYSTFNVEEAELSTGFYIQKQLYEGFLNYENADMYLIPTCSILFVLIVVYLGWSVGHKQGEKGIWTHPIDKISYEIVTGIAFIIIGILISISIIAIGVNNIGKLITPIWILSYLGCYACFAIWVVTTIRRIKAKELWHSFLIYKIGKAIKDRIKKIGNGILDKQSNKRKIFFLYWAFVILLVIFANIQNSFLSFVILIILVVWTYYKIINHNQKINQIKEALQEIYEGKKEVHLQEEELEGVLKEMAKYINDIAGGFSNAIEQSLKSERLKTELITNVSHDIKTPLTSIINYVDLLKKENIEDAKIEQYIAILDTKSQRLKKLIEDLVEASKVSSGNVKLNIETIDLKELLNQTTGEFEDRFENKRLVLDMNLPKEEVKIKADNRYLYRVIENLFSNITKYAMENSRVYIELINTGYEITLEMKNISKERLNISSDELMQRFVRGDKARYTEGSGLGLSIAQSLTELQGGSFDIKIDGDLFKVKIIWKK